MRPAVITMLIFLLAPVTMAQESSPEPLATLSIEPYQGLVGDRLRVEIRVHAPLAREIMPPALEERLGPFAIVEQSSSQMRSIFGSSLLIHHLELVAFNTGDQILPGLSYQAIDDFGNSQTVRSPSALIAIRSVAEGPDGPRDVADYSDIMRPETESKAGLPWWVWLFITLLALTMIGGLLIWWRRRMPGSVRRMLNKTPAEQALEALYELDKANLLRAEEFDKYYTELSRILRRYLGLRYQTTALEMTSAELSAKMKPLWNDINLNHDSFTDLLTHCDLAKFARNRPGISQGSVDIEFSRQIIYKTRNDLERPEKEAA